MIRLLLAAALAFALSTLLTRLTIDLLTRSKIGQPIREDGPEGHMVKAGTPTMGGIGIVLGALAGGLWAKLRDLGINDPWMKEVTADLAPGHAAAFFQLPHVYATHLIRELRRFDGRLLHNSLRDIDSTELEEALSIIP